MKNAKHFPTFVRWWSQICAVNYRRLAVHFLITLAALAVLCVSVLAAVWNYQRCMGIAKSTERIGGHIVYGKDGRRFEGRPMTPQERSVAEWYEAKARKYRMAAWLPLLLLAPAPPQPES